jgi:GT2 family glycosyltransferase
MSQSSGRVSYSVVVPTVGRASLARCLVALDTSRGPAPEAVLVVDDRRRPEPPLALPETSVPVEVVLSGGRGPAAARNVGWRAAPSAWVAFLDDDVVPGLAWRERLDDDLRDLPDHIAGSQGRVRVPLPVERRPTDAERGTAALASGRWITADMAYRWEVLAEVGGFDERFRRAYREDSDLALRVRSAGYGLVTGGREVVHPVRPSGFLASVRAQAGNADDALMRRRHGRGWRRQAGTSPGRLRLHALTTAAGATALALVARRRRIGALVAGAVWAGLTGEFAARRVLAGPRTPIEIARMAVTSVLIPPVACAYRVLGTIRHARVRPPWPTPEHQRPRGWAG